MSVSRRNLLSAGIMTASMSLSSSEPAAVKAATPTPTGVIGLSGRAPSDGSVDASAAIQQLINGHPSHAVLDGEGGVYRLDRPLTIPTGSRFLTLRNLTLLASGDTSLLQAKGPVHFFTLESVMIDCTAHRTKGRAAIDLRGISQSTFRDIWIYGASGRTVGMFGSGDGSSPYYNQIEHCYFGSALTGIRFDDAGGPRDACNNNTIVYCRFQPGPDAIGIYIGANCQSINLLCNVFEAKGGVGAHLAGVASVLLGNRFEGLTEAMRFAPNALGTVEIGNYADSNSTPRQFLGASRETTSLIGGVTGPAANPSMLSGSAGSADVEARRAIEGILASLRSHGLT